MGKSKRRYSEILEGSSSFCTVHGNGSEIDGTILPDGFDQRPALSGMRNDESIFSFLTAAFC